MKDKNSRRWLRICLATLILCNMLFIFYMSAQNGVESGNTSRRLTGTVARLLVWNFDSLSPLRQTEIVEAIHGPLRTCAHMAEFGMLGGLVFAFLLTFPGNAFPKFLNTQGFVLLYAVADECHQWLRAAGRAAQLEDVAVDLSGSLAVCGILALLLLFFQNKRTRMKIETTHYTLPIEGLKHPLLLAHVSDLHGMGEEETLDILCREKPDIILIPGDLMEDQVLADPQASGYTFLRKAASLAPTFYSLGNHETGCYHSGKPWTKPTKKPLPANARTDIAATGAVLLDNESTDCMGLRICGLTSGLDGRINRPDEKALKAFCASPAPRVLLCHHPEYFMPYLKDTSIELTLSGHAHGGQWRFFGRGTYAPGQGIFPKYTAGVLEGRCVISRGIGNHTHFPRIFNKPQVIMIHAVPKSVKNA